MMLDFGSVAHLMLFTVLECECPSILGMPFLKSVNPVIDWKSGQISFPAKISSDLACAVSATN